MSSVAADIGRPSNYHYGASKAALTNFCEGMMLRCNDKPFNIRIIKVAGFISSPMTKGKAQIYYVFHLIDLRKAY